MFGFRLSFPFCNFKVTFRNKQRYIHGALGSLACHAGANVACVLCRKDEASSRIKRNKKQKHKNRLNMMIKVPMTS